MAIRLLGGGFVLLQALIWGYYFWSWSLLHIDLFELEFDAREPTAARIGALPYDRYRVVFRFTDGFGQGEAERSSIVQQLLQEDRVGVEIRVTGFLWRKVLEYSSVNISTSREWHYSNMGSYGSGLWGPAEFRAFPLERYTITARLSGESDLLERKSMVLGLKAARDNGYHGLGHIILSYLTAALFAFMAGVWLVYRLVVFLARGR